MFSPETRDHEQLLRESVEQARAARAAGRRFFQVYLGAGGPLPERWLVEAEQADLVEALEAEGWIVDTVGDVHEPEYPSHFRVATVTGSLVGTIYTFRAAS